MYNSSLETLQKTFYDHHPHFTNFKNITSEQIKGIDSDVQKLKETFNKTESLKTKLNFYIRVLKALTKSYTSEYVTSYDDRVIFLIRSTDPNLEALQTYLKYDFPSSEKIKNLQTSNPSEANVLKEQRKKEQNKCSTEIREKIGFYDPQLLKYEIIFQKKFGLNISSLACVKKDYSNQLFNHANFIRTFSQNAEKIKELEQLAQEFIATFAKENLYTTTIYHILYNHKKLKLENLEDQFVFLISTCDPTLKLLAIFEEENTWDNVKKRALEELGFFNKDLIRIEKIYYSTLKPELDVSPWLNI